MNTIAVEMIPIRLIISITIIGAIAGILVVASNTLHIYLAEHQVEEQCQLVQSTLSTMMESGVARDINEIFSLDGSKRVITLYLPDSLIYLSFGGDPDPFNTGNLTSGLLEDGAAIFYKVDGGSKQVIWLSKETFRFREGAYVNNKWIIKDGGGNFLINSGGKTTLVFECVQENHVTYLLVHGNET